MNPTVAQKASNTVLDFRDGDSLFLVEIPYPLDISHQAIVKAIKKLDVSKAKGKHLGCRIVLATMHRHLDVDSNASWIVKALQDEGVVDANVFDYIEVVQLKADKKEDETIAIEILAVTPKREAWL